jgi:formylglycine-generating enzyme required for sulfatase activity
LPVPTTTFWLGVRAEDPDGKVCMQHGGSNFCDPKEEPASQATVRAFRLDRFEVTVGRYRKFVEAGTLQPAAGSGKHGYLNGGTEPGWVSLISFPDGAFGHADMAGNAFEWVLDRYAPYPARCEDCANLTATGNGVVRGGAGTSSDSELCAAYRGQTFGGTGVSGPYGIRCARPAK